MRGNFRLVFGRPESMVNFSLIGRNENRKRCFTRYIFSLLSCEGTSQISNTFKQQMTNHDKSKRFTRIYNLLSLFFNACNMIQMGWKADNKKQYWTMHAIPFKALTIPCLPYQRWTELTTPIMKNQSPEAGQENSLETYKPKDKSMLWW